MEHQSMTPEAGGAASAVKLAVAWGGWGIGQILGAIGLHAWSDFAGMTAGILSLAMFAHLVWKWRREMKGPK
jgi:hypothetical protein